MVTRALRVLGVMGVAAGLLFAASAANAQGYNSAAPAVIDSTLSKQGGQTTITTIVGGYSGNVGGGSNIFGGGGGTFGTGSQTSQTPYFRAGASGFSAGDGGPKIGVWVNSGATFFDEDQPFIDSDGTVVTVGGGADYRVNDWLVGGLSAGYENQNIDTTFNSGTLDANGGYVAPYFLVQLVKNKLFVDGTVGYAGLSEDLTRLSGGTNVTGSTDVTRIFAAGNISANFAMKNFRFRPSTGILWLRSKTDGFTESNGTVNPDNITHFGQFKAGARLSRMFALKSGNWIEPFISGQFEYDFKTDLPTAPAGQIQPTNENTGGTIGGGLYFYLGQRISGGINFGTEVGRSDFSQYNVTGTVRVTF